MKIAFFNLSTIGSEIINVKDTLTYSYIRRHLPEDILLLPDRNLSRSELQAYVKKILPDLDETDILAVSASTFSYPLAKFLSKIIRAYLKDLTILMGGPHVTDLATAKKSLCEAADLAIIGDMQALVELNSLLDKKNVIIRGKKIIFGNNSAPDGLYYYDNEGKIQGKGTSSAKLIYPLYNIRKVTDESCELDLLLNNYCPNNCGYCNSPKNKIEVPIDNYISEIEKEPWSKKIRKIFLYDNNPLWGQNRTRTEEFFKLYRKEFNVIPDVVLYADPSFFIELEEFEYAMDFIKKLDGKNNNIFFGRETVDQEVAFKIKRKYLGKERDQERLDKEHHILKKFAELTDKLSFTMVISYILSPFETAVTLNKMLEEVMLLSKHSRVIIKSNFLWPLPGTEIYKLYSGKCIPVDDLNLDSTDLGSINYWDIGFENSLFLELCFALKARIHFDYRDLYYSYLNLSLVRLARELAFNTYKGNMQNIIETLPDELKAPLGGRLAAFGKKVGRLNIKERKSLVELTGSYFKIFFKADKEFINKIKQEYTQLLRFKELYFKPSSSS